jgi:hypothetical protein
MLDGRLAQFVGDFNQIPAIPGQAIIDILPLVSIVLWPNK